MKKGTRALTFTYLGLFLTTLLISWVSAAEGAAAGTAVRGLFSGLGEFITALFGGSIPIQRLFLAILLFMVIYSFVQTIFGKDWVGIAAGIAITAISMVAINDELLNAIALQYSAMGATILTIIPLIIMLIFTIKLKSLTLRRITWMTYAIYYFALFAKAIYKAETGSAIIIYLIAGIFGLLMIFLTKFLGNLMYTGELEDEEEKAIRGIRFRQKTRKVLNAEGASILGSGAAPSEPR